MLLVAIPFIWQDLMSCENTFPSRAHALCRWYGLRDFVVVMPAPNMEDIVSENRINMLLSSFAIAANNTLWYCSIYLFLSPIYDVCCDREDLFIDREVRLKGSHPH